MNVLAALGLTGAVRKAGVVATHLRFQNHRGKVLTTISNGSEAKYGQPAIVLPRATFHQILVAEALRRGVHIDYKKRLTQIHDVSGAPVIAHFADGTYAEGDFLVGADGIWSHVRKLIIPDAPEPIYTGLVSIGGFAPPSVRVPGTSAEEQIMQMTLSLRGFFGYAHTLAREGPCIMWWSTLPSVRPVGGNSSQSADQSKLRHELLASHHDWPTPIETLIATTEHILKGPIFDVATLPRWSSGRVVLIGDAAHAMSPHAGQGASIALEDTMYLATLLQGGRRNYEATFVDFQQGRKARAEKIVAQARRNGDQKRTLSAGAAWTRDTFISLLAPTMMKRIFHETFSYKLDWPQDSRTGA